MVEDKVLSNISGQRDRSTLQKVIETGALVLSWIVMGMYMEVSAPTMIDLKYRLNTGYSEIASAIGAGGIGTFPGCIVGGFLVDKFGAYSHFTLAMALNLAAVSVVLIPWVPNVYYLWILSFLTGFGLAIHNSAGTRINLNIWKEKSASPTILMHLGYGIGSFLTPLYSNPFLGTETSKANDSTAIFGNLTFSNTSTINLQYCDENACLDNSRIEYAFAISAVSTTSLSFIFLIFQFYENKIKRQIIFERKIMTSNEDMKNQNSAVGMQDEVSLSANEIEIKKQGFLEMINPASCAKGRFWYGSSIIFFSCLYFMNAGGAQRFLSQFIRSFSIDQLKFSKTEGSLLNTSFWISFSCGRFIFFILARFLSVRILIVIETGGVLLASILLAIFANSYSIALWVLIQPVAFFIGPMWPTGVSWTDYHIELTGMGMASQMLGASVGFLVYLSLIGYLYDNIGPQCYVYQALGTAIIGFTIAVTLDLIGSRHGNRFESEPVVNTIDAQEDTNKDTLNSNRAGSGLCEQSAVSEHK